jgi:hypothetical protein
MNKVLGIVCMGLVLFSGTNAEVLSGFKRSIWYGEQVLQINEPAWAPEVSLLINAPSKENFNPRKKVILVFYALPNGNTIEQTIGNNDSVKADWHFNIQHIGAQIRFLRNQSGNANLVVCYLAAKQKSWGTWRKSHPDEQIRVIVDSVRAMFKGYYVEVCLNGHSGGGNFVFGFINSYDTIPAFITRIAFLDSNYAYDESLGHGKKLVTWLKSSCNNHLCILAYNDSIALYNGKPFVSPTGGTWYRSKRIAEFLGHYFKVDETQDTSFIRYSGLNDRLNITLKQNSQRSVLHTVQVERNGFIHSMLSGTKAEEKKTGTILSMNLSGAMMSINKREEL